MMVARLSITYNNKKKPQKAAFFCWREQLSSVLLRMFRGNFPLNNFALVTVFVTFVIFTIV
jgi:hypothetical protein